MWQVTVRYDKECGSWNSVDYAAVYKALLDRLEEQSGVVLSDPSFELKRIEKIFNTSDSDYIYYVDGVQVIGGRTRA